MAAPLAERLTARCLELVRIPSVTGDERAITDHLEHWARKLAAKLPVVRHGNALVIGAPDGKRPCVGLVGHTDTVPPVPRDQPARVEGDKLFGLGASDMKSGLAVMQLLAEDLDLAALPFALVWVFYDREEGPYADDGLEPLLAQHAPLRDVDLAVVMEPTDNSLQLGCVGSLHAKLTVQGKAAHSARPWQGDNAVHKAWPLLKALSERGVRDTVVEGLTFRDAMSVTLAQGGRAKNVVPERFELNINYRFAPVGSIEQATERAKDEVRRLVGDSKDIGVEFVDLAPPGPVPQKNALLDHLVKTGNLRREPKQAWTDVARLAQAGIDAVNFGPGATAQAHQKGEWVEISAMVRAYEVLVGMVTVAIG